MSEPEFACKLLGLGTQLGRAVYAIEIDREIVQPNGGGREICLLKEIPPVPGPICGTSSEVWTFETRARRIVATSFD